MVTRESEYIALIMAASHGLEVKGKEVLNPYVITPNKEFGENAGKSSTIFRVSDECRCIV